MMLNSVNRRVDLQPPSPWLPLAAFYSSALVPFYSGVDTSRRLKPCKVRMNPIMTLVAKSFSSGFANTIGRMISGIQDPSRSPCEPIDVAPSGRPDLAA